MERTGASASFVKLTWISKKWSWKLLEPGSFDACKNAIVPIIVILGCLEMEIEISDVGIKTMEFNDCREISKNNRDTNGMLATMWEEARFSHKDGQKFINTFV